MKHRAPWPWLRLLCRFGLHDMRPDDATTAQQWIERAALFRCTRCGAREDG